MSEFVKAAQNGNLNEVKRLLNLNPDIINEKDREYDTAILKACRNCNAGDVVHFLLEKGANITDEDYMDSINQTPLIIAAFNGCKDIVKMLLDAGANIDHKNDQGENALISAVQEGHTDVVKLLLEEGADVTQANAEGETAISLAIMLKQKKEIIELLREKPTHAMGLKKGSKKNKRKTKRQRRKTRRKTRRKIINKYLKLKQLKDKRTN
jgi:ankyrin repeat protein